MPAEAAEIAREVALDHWLTWQLMHVAFDAAGVAKLALAYQRGESLDGRALPEARIEEDSRKVDSIPREPPAQHALPGATAVPAVVHDGHSRIGAADALLLRGDADAAIAAYCAGLADEPDPAAWIGLALAVHRLPSSPSRSVLAAHLPLLYEMHARLASNGIHADPLELAARFK